MKPSQEAYVALSKYLNVSPEKIFYLDDKAENIETGSKVGFHSFQCLNKDIFPIVQK